MKKNLLENKLKKKKRFGGKKQADGRWTKQEKEKKTETERKEKKLQFPQRNIKNIFFYQT